MTRYYVYYIMSTTQPKSERNAPDNCGKHQIWCLTAIGRINLVFAGFRACRNINVSVIYFASSRRSAFIFCDTSVFSVAVGRTSQAKPLPPPRRATAAAFGSVPRRADSPSTRKPPYTHWRLRPTAPSAPSPYRRRSTRTQPHPAARHNAPPSSVPPAE